MLARSYEVKEIIKELCCLMDNSGTKEDVKDWYYKSYKNFAKEHGPIAKEIIRKAILEITSGIPISDSFSNDIISEIEMARRMR